MSPRNALASHKTKPATRLIPHIDLSSLPRTYNSPAALPAKHPLLVGISGPMGSGKSTTAKLAAFTAFHHDSAHSFAPTTYTVISFADALRAEAKEVEISAIYAHETGISDITWVNQLRDELGEELDHVSDELLQRIFHAAQNPPDYNPHTPIKKRELLQLWGTNVRREYDTDYWLNQTANRVHQLHEQGYHVFIDDVRFPNEADFCSSLNDPYYRVVRLNIDPDVQADRLTALYGSDALTSDKRTHPSETALDDYEYFDITVDTITEASTAMNTLYLSIMLTRLAHNIVLD